MLLYWSEIIHKDNIPTFQDVVNQLPRLNSHNKYTKTVLYTQVLIQQATMLIADILNANL